MTALRTKDKALGARQKSAVAFGLKRASDDLQRVYNWTTFDMDDNDVLLFREVISHIDRVRDAFMGEPRILHLIIYSLEDGAKLHPEVDHMATRLKGLTGFVDISEYTPATVIVRAYAGNLDQIRIVGLGYLQDRGVNVINVFVTARARDLKDVTA